MPFEFHAINDCDFGNQQFLISWICCHPRARVCGLKSFSIISSNILSIWHSQYLPFWHFFFTLFSFQISIAPEIEKKKQQPRIWINTKSTEFQHKNRTKFPNKTNVWSNHLIHAHRTQTDIEQQLNAYAALTNKTVKPFSRDKLCISKVFINFLLAIDECGLFLLLFFFHLFPF